MKNGHDENAIEMTLFVIGPGLIALPWGGQWRSAVVTSVVNLVLLGAIYLITSYGVLSMSRWAAWQTLRQVETVAGLAHREDLRARLPEDAQGALGQQLASKRSKCLRRAEALGGAADEQDACRG